MSLADLLNQATPEPWVSWSDDEDERLWQGNLKQQWDYYLAVDDARLAALAPDMARLLIDMAAYVSIHSDNQARELAIRFAALDAKAGGQT